MPQSKEERLINIPSDPAKAKVQGVRGLRFRQTNKTFPFMLQLKKIVKVRLGGKLLERKKAKVKITEINNPNDFGV